MKKITSLLLCACMLLCFVPAGAAAGMPGDVNRDGSVTAADARLALRMAVGLETAEPGSDAFLAAEVTGDGAVTAADARLILRAAVGLETLKTPEEPIVTPPAGEKPTRREIYEQANRFTVEITSEMDLGEALGSGFFISEDGRILTNYHVIETTSSLKVTTADGTEYTDVTVLGFDRDVDIALLKIEGSFPCAALNKTDYGTADTVYALGSSLGLTDTFSEGMISNAARRLEDFSDVTYIQHTAAISEGNSGGPLMDEYGRVIGLNTLGADDGQMLNFAVPVRYLDELDLSHPMTVSEFSEAEQQYKSVKLLGNFGAEALLRPGAVAVFPFEAVSRTDSALEVSCGSDAVSAEVTESYYNMLVIVAQKPCENVPVKVFFTEAPEVSVTVNVTVSADAPANSGGLLKDVPDFGALIGVAPTLNAELSYSALPLFEYSAGLLRNLGNAESIRTRYEAALEAAGFTLSESQTVFPLLTTTTYVYTNQKLGIAIQYVENRVGRNLKNAQIMIG